MSTRYRAEQRGRAVKMVLGHLREYKAACGACKAIGPNWESAPSHSGSGHGKL